MKVKKNKAMRLASVLLVLTLLTTCMTAGTFAKYTTGAEGEATARVAKFGVEVSVTPGDVFGKQYSANGTVVEDSNGGITVQTSATDMVVAPGTTGSMTFSITGKPETKVNVDITLNAKKNENLPNTLSEVMLVAGTYKDVTTDQAPGTFIVADGGYYPVKWTLKDNDVVVKYIPLNSAEKSLENVKLSEIEDYFKVISAKDYNANYDLSKITGGNGTGNYTLSWSWDFDDNQKGTNDKADTLLGQLAFKPNLQAKQSKDTSTFEKLVESDYCLTEAFKLKISVTQVD